MRGHVAMSGNLGYELDLNGLSGSELNTIRAQVRFYTQYRPLIQFGRFLRLVSPFDSTEAAWMFIHPEIDDILVFWFRLYGEANRPVSGFRLVRLRLAELDPFGYYRERERRIEYTGSELMNTGLILPPSRLDYDSRLIILERIR
jgi:alpha-galactosidase